MRPLSIIIPHFEKQAALKKTWEELKFQIQPEDEILIVDDHSPSGVPDFECKCTKTIQPPKHVPHIYRLNSLKNHGVEHAKHDACIIIDPDCIPSKNFLSYARNVYDPSVLFGGHISYLDKNGNPPKEYSKQSVSRWLDEDKRGCRELRGGCMFFSKQRASLAGLFDTDFDGNWGSGEHPFGSVCYNSGMRLRYDRGLTVFHQWHEKNRPGNSGHNKRLFEKKVRLYHESLNYLTPYKPAVVVLVVSTKHSQYIEQGMRAIFRHAFPFKVRLVNNGDQSEQHQKEMALWKDRWAVDYVEYESQKPLSVIRSAAMRDYSEKGYKYLIMLDADITPMTGALTNFVLEMEKNKHYHALSGYIVEGLGKQRFMGGTVSEDETRYDSNIKPETMSTEYVNSNFTIVRLNKIVPYLETWNKKWDDWEWSAEVIKQGLNVGVTGKSGAYRQRLFTTNSQGLEKIERTDERVAVSILTLMRPFFLNQCLESTLSTKTPIKIIITNQADYSQDTMKVINKWRRVPHVHYRVNDPPKWPGPSRAEVFKLAKEAGFEYIITLDDDCTLLPGAIDELVKAADEHPEFHALAGYLITPHRKAYMLGGTMAQAPSGKYLYTNFPLRNGVHETEFICNGFRIIRLDPLILPDEEFTIGLTDFDWAANAKSQGLRLAVCGEAGAYHKFLFVDGKKVTTKNPPAYQKIRRNREEIGKMKKRFTEKWGYRI